MADKSMTLLLHLIEIWEADLHVLAMLAIGMNRPQDHPNYQVLCALVF